MNRLIIMVLLLCALTGCGDSDKAKEKSAKDTREEKIWAQMTKNGDMEKISLLGIKYGIDEQLLKSILSEYEIMVFGQSFIDLELPIPENLPTVVSISSAIEKLSIKYSVSKEVLSQIIIELRMMEKANE